jgi:MFS family permease
VADGEGGGAVIRGTAYERRQVRLALISSTVGTTIEWYDFFLYGTAAALVFPSLFFPNASQTAGVLEAFATYAVGFAARPVGAAIFGRFGDKYGRKSTLIATLLLMGIGSVIIGVLPTYQLVGIWGAVLLVIFRVIQGIGVGGEWGGAVGIAMEWGQKGRRGWLASWPQFGVPAGLVIADVLVVIFSTGFGDNFVSSSYLAGWRIPFWISAVIVGIGLLIRLKVDESPLFTRVQKEKKIERTPVLTSIKRHPKTILTSDGIRTAEQAPFYIFTSFVLTYGVNQLDFNRNFLLYAVLGASVLSLFDVPFFGWLSDKIGRKRMYVIGALSVAVWAFPYWGLLGTAAPVLVVIGIVVSLIPHDMMYGPQAAFIAEAYPTRLRYSGAGIGYQFASVFAGGPAPLIAAALLPISVWWIPVYILVCVAATLAAAVFLPDRTNVDLGTEFGTAPAEAGSAA